MLGGDSSVCCSSILAQLQKFRKMHVIWIGAHPDINTFTSSISGNKHGTTLSVCTGIEKVHWASRLGLRMLPFDRLVYSGVRKMDTFETEVIRKNGIKTLTPSEIIDFIR